MKPGMSAARTGVLPICWATFLTASITSVDVPLAAMISTKGMTGAGLKKCIPTTRSGFFAAEAMEGMEREEVLVARMVSGPQLALSEEKISRLRSMSSGAASMIMSYEAASSRLVVVAMRDVMAF